MMTFRISKYRHIIYTNEMKGCVNAMELIEGITNRTFKLLKKQVHVECPTATKDPMKVKNC